MLFNSTQFLVFFPIVCIIYYIIPHRIRHLFLLGCSYYFYMCWNPKYALLMLTSTVITYCSGILLESADNISEKSKSEQRKKWYIALSFVSNLSILFVFKYLNFAIDSFSHLFQMIGVQIRVPAFDIVLPVGISFYTFQALSYTMDVYRKEIKPEKNFFKYALFVSFFPQLVAGPIERSKNLISQVSEKHEFDYIRVRKGLTRMLYGLFQKVVLAEYLAIVVDNIYNTFNERTGLQLLIATVCFAFQIYCDFGSYSNIAIGAAQVMGFRLMENFNTPYFSRTVAEFWRRWHISLSTWFRDYLYIPLGGNRKGKLRKNINLMIVFLVSGLWHGASWHFVIWGFLNGFYQVMGSLLKPLRCKVSSALKMKEDSLLLKAYQTVVTFALVDISWVFFRAGTKQSLHILKKIALFWRGAHVSVREHLSVMGLNDKTVWVLVIALVILLIVDLFRYHGIRLVDWLDKQHLVIRWIVYYAFLYGILIFGIYGPGFDASQFIYFQF